MRIETEQQAEARAARIRLLREEMNLGIEDDNILRGIRDLSFHESFF